MAAPRRESAAEIAERFIARRERRMPRYVKPSRRPSGTAPMQRPAPSPSPTDRIIVDFGRATLEEIHRRLVDCLVDATDTHITRVAEDMVRTALERGS